MKIGIICASDEELMPFLSAILNDNIYEKAMLTFHEGKIGDATVVALFSGVGKVNAAVATQILIDCFEVNAVINSGTAGAIDEKLNILDTVIATECCYHDVSQDILTEFHPWMKTVFFESSASLLEQSKNAVSKLGFHNVYYGRMVTGEAFILNDGREKIIQEFSPLSVDMETASIAHACYVNGIPFLSVRCITDTAEHSGSEQFEKNCARASAIAATLIIEIIKNTV